jgi:HlyD family secretion protein
MNRHVVLAGGLLAAAVVLIVVLVVMPRVRPTEVLSGYVEAEPLYLSAPVSGQVTRLAVARGERAQAGALLFAVDDRSLQGQRAQAAGQFAAAQDQARAAQATQAQLDAAVVAAEANAAEAEREAVRAAQVLKEGGTISLQDAQKARAAADSAHAQLLAARRQAAAGAAQAVAAQGQVRQAQGAQADATARLSQATAYAPGSAQVEDVFFQQGEWAPANQPILSLLPDDRIRIRFFVPEAKMADYRVGARVRFSCDGCPDGLSATINYVSPRPEFTPPVIYSRETRDRLVYMVEALPSRRLNAGLPVDVVPLGARK